MSPVWLFSFWNSGMMLPSNFEGRYFLLSEPAELFCNLRLVPHTKKETMTHVLLESISCLIIEQLNLPMIGDIWLMKGCFLTEHLLVIVQVLLFTSNLTVVRPTNQMFHSNLSSTYVRTEPDTWNRRENITYSPWTSNLSSVESKQTSCFTKSTATPIIILVDPTERERPS